MPTTVKLSAADRQDVAPLAALLKQNSRASAYQFEGAAIFILRGRRCLAGRQWEVADQVAREVVRLALWRIGAKRPSYTEAHYDTIFHEERSYKGVWRTYECQRCGKPFSAQNPARWCSARCGYHERHQIRGIDFTCEVCGTSFTRFPRADRPAPRFCSLSCSRHGRHDAERNVVDLRKAIAEAPGEGLRALARRLGVSPTTVKYWRWHDQEAAD